MNNQDYAKLKSWIKSVDDKLDNHLVGIAKEVTEIKTDMSWIKKFFWVVISTSIIAIVAAFFSLILK